MSTDAALIASHAVLPLQPAPIQALTAAFEAADGTAYTVIIRRWHAAAAARCRLCRVCTARTGPDRQAVCIVAVEGGVAAGSAPLFSADGLA